MWTRFLHYEPPSTSLAIPTADSRSQSLEWPQKVEEKVCYLWFITTIIIIIPNYCSNKRSTGHLGCSRGFSGQMYKEYLHKDFNSQGRENLHSVLEMLSSSFRQMSYKSYMQSLCVFFGIRNLKNKGLIWWGWCYWQLTMLITTFLHFSELLQPPPAQGQLMGLDNPALCIKFHYCIATVMCNV